MDIEEIKDAIALRYPYLLVDRVVESDGEKLVALKNVTINEPFFQGHFPEPGPSVMPGTMIVEGMAQVSGLLARKVLGEEGIGYLVGVDGAKFRQKVTPGDQLILKAEKNRVRSSLCKVDVKAFVDEELVAEAEITLAF
ncbi:MAG: 3-hydroxyacyl-ACP dehydratase FabZ [Candidatus Bipolaricaulota bacterium]|nr:3-hydroxyacyl-ACP dehydratase FabZ [Candidatus Bipolaricaulota bacterium]MBS3791683.1 3-hydroxyacyl-ACP dehydratase FabZ [Candidatus Bipolaricaulota bacterium]